MADQAYQNAIHHLQNLSDTHSLIEALKDWQTQCRICPYIFEDPKNSGTLSTQYGNELDTTHLLEDVTDRFAKRLEFGTAGLRGVMGCGFDRMNQITVIQTTQGVVSYLKETTKRKTVCIGYDARYNSRRMAHAAAAVCLSEGFKVIMSLDEAVPTPLLAKATTEYSAACGIMITASHNPCGDNGYKLYEDHGRQIIPNEAEAIVRHIDRQLNLKASAMKLLNSKTALLNEEAVKSKDFSDSLVSVFETYLAQLLDTLVFLPRKEIQESPVKVVYTAMHGVGGKFVSKLFKNALGVSSHNFIPVSEQQEPDPEFRTVSFPNPEETGALDFAIATANRSEVSLIFANDPDADRFAAAEKIAGKWRQFSGDELGILFADFLHRHNNTKEASKCGFTTTVVSSRMLSKFSEVNGYDYSETLTGFKWLMDSVIRRESSPQQPIVSLLAYEEALGYCIGSLVKDKDGISAAGVFYQLATELHTHFKMTVHDRLKEIRRKYSHFVTYNSYYISRNAVVTEGIFKKFRNDGNYLTQCGNHVIQNVRDVTTGFDSSKSDKKCFLPITHGSEMVTLYMDNGAVITIRTSGTEPKIKWYSEMSGTDPVAVEKQLKETVDVVVETVFEPKKNKLESCG